jgi:hypothetical protein
MSITADLDTGSADAVEPCSALMKPTWSRERARQGPTPSLYRLSVEAQLSWG